VIRYGVDFPFEADMFGGPAKASAGKYCAMGPI